MSKNIIIEEGGVARSFSGVEKLQTELVGGGSCNWVPEDETKLTTKSISKNGTYNASSDDAYGYSKVTVNVAGGNGSADCHGKPTTSGGINPGGVGSSVIGTDPETGNEVGVGVDEDGNLVNTPLPSSIVLVTNPTKMDCNDGESIDLSGAVVVAKMADGTTWTDAEHPSGHVPLSEIVCEPDTAYVSEYWGIAGGVPIEQSDDGKFASDILVNDTELPVNSPYSVGGFTFTYHGYNIVTQYYTSTVQYKGISSSTSTAWRSRKWRVEGTFSGNTATSWWLQMVGTGNSINLNDYLEDVTIYGGQSQGCITLKWARPGDGKVLSTTMEINVGAHSTESSSGTEFSGGGGTF